MSTGDCICPGEELTLKGSLFPLFFSLVDLTVSPMTWNNVSGCYPKSFLFPWNDLPWTVPIAVPHVVNNNMMPALLTFYFIYSFEMNPLLIFDQRIPDYTYIKI